MSVAPEIHKRVACQYLLARTFQRCGEDASVRFRVPPSRRWRHLCHRHWETVRARRNERLIVEHLNLDCS